MRLFRILWRVLTALIVLLAAYGTAFMLVPYLDHRMPVFAALLIGYVVLAYILLPLVSRFWRVVFKPNHIPLYVVTSDGWPADPVNIAIVAKSKRQLIRAMARSGWQLADKRTFTNKLRLIRSFIFNTEYPTAPFTALYLFGRPFDVGFQKPRGGKATPRTRHHVRFWRLETSHSHRQHQEHYSFWKEILRRISLQHRSIWIGAALDDNGPIGIHWRDLQITHKNDADTNRERDLIITDLKKSGVVRRTTILQAGQPFVFYGQTVGNKFICDGQIKVVTLKPLWRQYVRPSASAPENIS